MNVMNLIEQGIELMLLGMGMVFFILGLLVIVIKTASTLILKYEPVASFDASKLQGSNKIGEDVVEAISIAVQRYRSK
ncbi:MAG: hypothetical protein COB22_02025 [Cycloclasticus sp.]|nr:MAG: hypothetical protein COB22_02025 [Cycloclasticus sp.]